MRLVEGWRNFWRWNSVQLFALMAVIPPVWAELPPDIKDFIPIEWRPWLLGAMAFCGIFARLRDQTK